MIIRLLFIFLFCFCNQCFSQGKNRLDSISSNASLQKNSQQQQTMLLSRQQQAEIIEQTRQKQLFEKQKQEFTEREKQLMAIKIQKDQRELELEKKNAEQAAKEVQLQAKVHEFIKDEAIREQNKELLIKRKWNFYLTVLFLVVIGFAVVAYYTMRKTKQLNDLISKQYAELEEMGMVKDTILGVVSHDMRVPVNSLLSFSELIKAGTISEEKMGMYLDQISNTLNQTSATMNNLLNWTATQMQGFSPSIISVDMALVSEEIMENLVDRASDKKISIKNDIEVGCLVMADKNMIELILRNLLSNAIKYSSAFDCILISAREVEGKIIIAVQDMGVGMSSDKIKLFNALSKKPLMSTIGTAREKGTGLGLLLCKTFTRLMKGTIHVSINKNEKGLIFELTLPRAVSESFKNDVYA